MKAQASPTSHPPSTSRVDQVFCELLDVPRDQRRRALAKACGGDLQLFQQVQSLLADADRTDPLLRPGGAAGPGPFEPGACDVYANPEHPTVQSTLQAGCEIGRYRLLRELGRGGMGMVFLADRADGAFEQRVALKVVSGWVDGDALDRFRRERQILADLQHPRIARLVDGGVSTTAAGLAMPYLVMEYVDGAPLDTFCRHHDLDLRQRVRLLIDICTAVEAAHRHLIVHRDLKPSNVLIRPGIDGEAPEVKLLDFGIAKLLGGERADGPTVTAGHFLTPQYASPEQIRGEVITVASDVYQLGLLAYELIAGCRPYRLSGLSAAEAERKICHETPTRPSLLVATTTTRAKARDIQGDLDTIVLKALHKEPERRYASVEHLRLDLQRYLGGQPVSARPDTLRYRAGKFVQRHTVAVAASLLALLTLATLLSAFTWSLARERDETRRQAELAERKRAETEQVVLFFSHHLWGADPFLSQPELDLTARELLDKGVAALREDAFPGQPLVQAKVQVIAGEIYSRLALFDQAEPLLLEALELRRRAGGEDAEIAESLRALGDLYAYQDRFQDAEAPLRASLAIHQRLHGDEHEQVAVGRAGLANLLLRAGRYAEARKELEAAAAAHRAIGGEDSFEYAWVLSRLAGFRQAEGDALGARSLMQEAYDMTHRVGGPDHTQTAYAAADLARSYGQQGEHAAAAPLLREALRILELRLGRDSPALISEQQNLALSLYHSGEIEEATRLLRKALAATEAASGGRPSVDSTRIRYNLATFRLEQGDAVGAEQDLRALQQTQLDLLEPSHQQHGYTLLSLGAALLAQERDREAEPLLRRSLEHFETIYGPQSPPLAEPLLLLADLLARRGAASAADPLYRRALDLRRATMAPDSRELREAEAAYSDFLRTQGRATEIGAPVQASPT